MKQTSQQEEIADRCVKEFGQVVGDRSGFETQWQEVSERVWPAYSQTFTQNATMSPGSKNTDKIFDSTPIIALGQFTAVMDSLLTPRSQTWHRLTPKNPELAKRRDVQIFFEEATRRLFAHRYAPRSNFVGQNHQTYKSIGGFGNGSLFLEFDEEERGIRYRNIPIGEIYFIENFQRRVDGAYRCFEMTARQAVQQWPETVPDTIKTMADKSPEKKYRFLHVVRPRVDRDPERADYKGMPFVSWYISIDEKVVLSEGGFRVFPYAVGRYSLSPGEIYGRGPAMEVLPAIKMLNEMAKTVIKQGHRITDPVLLGHAEEGAMGAFSLKPGAMNYGSVTADGRVLVHTLPTGNLAISQELMNDVRMQINAAHLVTLFQILTENPQMTATEVLERAREKGILLAPTVGGLETTYVASIIEIEVSILFWAGLMPEVPEALVEADGEYAVQHDSPMTRLQRAEEAAGAERQVASTVEVANITQRPEMLDIYDFDTINRETADIRGVPARWLRAEEDVEASRAERAEAAQAEQVERAAPGAAALASSVAKLTAASGGRRAA